MRKTDKKIDNQLRVGLTAVCEHALVAYSGFAWITHIVDYEKYPKSLRIVCIFDTETQLSQFKQSGDKAVLVALIQHTLTHEGIEIKDAYQHVSFDTESACEQQHNGNWALRLSEKNRRTKLY
ncbi:Fis family transcriptional regulator [Shewanella livingstonensis]|uniref:Fis family transcriptional regulator n=1 Tax=Shewanella livingstonensis TaxID=150120 RepID=A0A3G8LV06_9GAMM|nr:Fis family transcriptional regulator [Shewanella livingstonensis]AZG73623.1 Fis family transcriptional regulator [Shewanella livingstonensis]